MMQERAMRLRADGLTYKAIGEALGISEKKAWVLVNREQYNQTVRESMQRYIARGNIAIVDMPEAERRAYFKRQLNQQ